MKYQKPKSKFTQTNKPEQNPIIKIVKESESNQESYAKFNFIQGKVMVSHIKVNESEILVKQTNRMSICVNQYQDNPILTIQKQKNKFVKTKLKLIIFRKKRKKEDLLKQTNQAPIRISFTKKLSAVLSTRISEKPQSKPVLRRNHAVS